LDSEVCGLGSRNCDELVNMDVVFVNKFVQFAMKKNGFELNCRTGWWSSIIVSFIGFWSLLY